MRGTVSKKLRKLVKYHPNMVTKYFNLPINNGINKGKLSPTIHCDNPRGLYIALKQTWKLYSHYEKKRFFKEMNEALKGAQID